MFNPTTKMLYLISLCLFGLVFGQNGIAPSKICMDVAVPVTINSTNLVWGLPKFANNLDVVAFVAAANRRDFAQNPLPLFSGVEQKTSTYTISGTWCQPRNGIIPTTALLATHGLTLDRSYWDSPYQPSNYSFVDFAVGRGYAVFFYDRLGVGQSSRLSGYVNQASIQVAILEELIRIIRNGGLKSRTGTIPRPNKIILLGHSYGSILSNALLAANPKVADGAILTGWNYDFKFGLTLATAQPRISNTFHRSDWANYDTGSLSPVDLYAAVNVFYKASAFDHAAAETVYKTSTPLAIAEAAVIPALVFAAPDFEGPVLFILGEFDYIMCTGNCRGDVEPAASGAFPASVGFQSYIHPEAGHNLNFHYNATGAYKVATDFLAKNRL